MRRYPSVDQQHAAAVQIVKLFPQLSNTRVTPTAPDESFFFWRNGGKEKGAHTGMIFHRIRNVIKQLPAGKHKYNRGTMPVEESVSTELVERAQLLRVMLASASVAEHICDEMDRCFPVLKLLLKEKKPVNDILDMFPHLCSYEGLVIRQMFERLYPNRTEGLKIEDVFSQCLSYSPSRFSRVEDDHIRGCLRIISHMPIRGQKRTLVGCPTVGEEHSASILIRWIGECLDTYVASPATDSKLHMVCVASPMKRGNYAVICEKKVIFETNNSIHAVEILFKCYAVLGVEVPPNFRMFWDFLACAIYNIIPHSQRTTVNRLVQTFIEVSRARIDNK
ncbi:uncharacterized protein LOC131692712 [Topomyia yanbarensis]|uniref:uncharacterized protein LOC131677228 n=1 Tax=Topomyia yanbarensis TaxID=2498891 RepID=UPI00273C9469|nr:uncharacterized protein LOC131677228 [Topomyia yanbarensis]XP_058820733.1 uncharacterized protein LOC131682939 [Topomyia yanbarensis]XP_058820940.1 uncharacterized protein LOC131683110 [Topomyia yanbarensis]XP_058820995.1 uncharacterized protein LOC131683173 [Topomyia yanbarensis]XP_058825080.1 uncharacterized protein LOC131685396 [Topomyia yanbarensis]XP_058825082.1 uncharacterized protein LOC131685397 [Topomyia yanbarensis]XP_058825168.1 uncharacterized protein LOC131685457 [Topomyia yan